MKSIKVGILSVFFSLIIGCASFTSNVQSEGSLIQTAASIATSEVLVKVTDPAKQKQDADMIYSLAVGLQALEGHAPSPAAIQSNLATFGASTTPELAGLASEFASIYAGYYQQYSNGVDVKAAETVLESVVAGAEQAAAPYK